MKRTLIEYFCSIYSNLLFIFSISDLAHSGKTKDVLFFCKHSSLDMMFFVLKFTCQQIDQSMPSYSLLFYAVIIPSCYLCVYIYIYISISHVNTSSRRCALLLSQHRILCDIYVITFENDRSKYSFSSTN